MNNKEKRELLDQAIEIMESGDEPLIRAFEKTIDGLASLAQLTKEREGGLAVRASRRQKKSKY